MLLTPQPESLRRCPVAEPRPDLRNRFLGCLVGSAVGGALGCAVRGVLGTSTAGARGPAGQLRRVRGLPPRAVHGRYATDDRHRRIRRQAGNPGPQGYRPLDRVALENAGCGWSRRGLLVRCERLPEDGRLDDVRGPRGPSGKRRRDADGGGLASISSPIPTLCPARSPKSRGLPIRILGV